MFRTTDVLGFIMRIALFSLLFCVFPLINHFFKSLIIQILFQGKREPNKKEFIILTISTLAIPTVVSIVYPKVASVLGFIGAIAGLIIVYVLPVVTYLKMVKTECEHPLLAKAIQ